MEILEVTDKEYAEFIRTPYHVFGSAAFNNHNRNKCEKVYYLLFKDTKVRLGIIGGIIEKSFFSPFSAPLGGFSFVSSDVRLQYIEDSVKSLKKWSDEKDFITINITLPPSIYDSSFIAKQINCMWREGFEISKIELNHSFDLEAFDENYADKIWYNARKNLRIALDAELQFIKCTSDEEKFHAYDIITINRETRGHPLRMTWQQVDETTTIVSADYFLVKNVNQITVASAIVFNVSNKVVQVIYWGDLPGYSDLKPMNFLSYKVFEYYKQSGKKVVDIGYSTENSVPNYGLCEFKESIGCDVNPKYTLTYKV